MDANLGWDPLKGCSLSMLVLSFRDLTREEPEQLGLPGHLIVSVGVSFLQTPRHNELRGGGAGLQTRWLRAPTAHVPGESLGECHFLFYSLLLESMQLHIWALSESRPHF